MLSLSRHCRSGQNAPLCGAILSGDSAIKIHRSRPAEQIDICRTVIMWLVFYLFIFCGGGGDRGWKRKSVGEIYCREKGRRSGGRERRKFWIYDSVSEVWPQGGIYNWDGEEKSGGVQLQVTDCHLDLHSVQVRPAHGDEAWQSFLTVLQCEEDSTQLSWSGLCCFETSKILQSQNTLTSNNKYSNYQAIFTRLFLML